jgi:hypothetical protein
MEREPLSYLVLFCALLLVRSTKATFEDSLRSAPLEGGALRLAVSLRSTQCLRSSSE